MSKITNREVNSKKKEVKKQKINPLPSFAPPLGGGSQYCKRSKG
jgi:hypothetical protein